MKLTNRPSRAIKSGLTAFALAALLITGCRAKPAPDSGFLDKPSLLTTEKDSPFERSWTSPHFADKTYTELYVAPVNVDYLMKENIWEMASFTSLSPDYVKQNIRQLADYQRDAVIKAANSDPQKKFKIVDKPGPDTLVLELALVQLVPSKPLIQAASYYTWIGTLVEFGASAATSSEDQGKGVVAIEGRTRDGANGQVNSEFADREHPPTAIIDVKALFWWEPAKPICDGWARQFVQLRSNPKGTKIEEIPNFKWLIF